MKKIYDILNDIKKYILSNLLMMSFIILTLITTTLLRFLTVGNYFELGPILADIFVLIIISLISNFIKKSKNKFIYFLIWIIVIVIVSVINSIYYTNYISYASISFLKTATQVVDVGDAVLHNVMEIKDLVYVLEIPIFVILYKILKKKNLLKNSTNEDKNKNFKNIIINAILVLISFCFTLTPIEISRFSNKYQFAREYIVMHYGCLVYQFNDLLLTFTSNFEEMFGYDEAYKEFRDFYDNKKIVNKNEYTDIFKDKNVIVIHAESIQSFAMNLNFNGKEVTPTLNKLAKEGIYFNNFYAVESVGTSSDTEFSFSTSLLPSSAETVFMNYYDRDYVSIQKLIKNNGYNVFSMHGNKCDFWNREQMHMNLGYDKFYCYTNAYDIDETIGLGLSDKSFFKQSVPIIKENSDNKFYATLIMLSNHTPFTDIVNYSDYDLTTTYIDEEGNVVKDDYLENTTLGNYIKSVNYADSAINDFINELDENGLLDNTVIVIYGDHDAKIKRKEFEKYYNHVDGKDLLKSDPNYKTVDDYEYEINRKVPFIIWTKDKQYNVVVDKVMSMLDVMPTLGNMLGVYNEYALGNDIFSIEDNIIVFPDGNWLTNKMYYNYQKDEGRLLNNQESLSSKYIEDYNEYAYKLISISNDIIIYNLLGENK